MQVKLCMVRGFQRLWAEMTFALVTVFGNLVISLVLGSVFYDLNETTGSFYGRGALLYFAILFNALSNALEVWPCIISPPNYTDPSRFCRSIPLGPSSKNTRRMPCTIPLRKPSPR